MSFHSIIELTSVADDMIYLYIPDDNFIGTRFQYEISNTEDKIFRKGYFLGTRVQLRINDLKDGNYFFNLRADKISEYKFRFEKKSDRKLMIESEYTCE